MLIKLLTGLGIIGLVGTFLLPAQRSARPAAYRSQCKNNLKQIGLALHNYVDTYHTLPPAYSVDAEGKPLHSWRTLILPFLDQKRLYETIDLSKAWDDPANAEARKTAISTFQCPAAHRGTHSPANYTTYVVIVGPNGCFRLNESTCFSEITDDRGETLMVIEVPSEHAVPWMSPMDADERLVMDFGPHSKLAHSGGTHALFVDGSVQFLGAEMPAAHRRALISIAGNDKLADGF